MSEPQDDETTEDPVEGVRVVNRDEAEAAIESGTAISRHTQGRLVSLVDLGSDEPDSSWADTGDVSAPAVRVLGEPTDRVSAAFRMPESVRGSTGSTTRSTAPTVLDDDFEVLDLRASDERDDQPAEQADEPTVQQPAATLPHWTEPATGEVPSVLASGNAGDSEAIGNIGDEPDEETDRSWSLAGLGDASRLGVPGDSPEAELNAAFEKLGERLEPTAAASPPAGDSGAGEPVDGGSASEEKHGPIAETIEEKVASLKKASIVTRSATAVVAVALALAAFSAGPRWALLLALTIIVLAAAEYFDALRRVGYRPATALGLVAVIGSVAGTYARGEAAIPLVFALLTAFTFLWYMTGVIKDSPTANIAVTLLGVMWIGVFGSFAALLLREPDHRGIAFLAGAVILVVAYDTAAYLGGVLFGRHTLAPSISPNKTWEGLITATIASVLVGAIIVPLIHPWGFFDGLALGIVIACVAPLGDLAESMVKRDLGLKDMGRLLPGHGGVLDRFDALLFALPATYYLVRMLNLA